MFKLIPTVRGGAVNSTLTYASYATVDHENARVLRVMIVDAANGSKFVEWIERS